MRIDFPQNKAKGLPKPIKYSKEEKVSPILDLGPVLIFNFRTTGDQHLTLSFSRCSSAACVSWGLSAPDNYLQKWKQIAAIGSIKSPGRSDFFTSVATSVAEDLRNLKGRSGLLGLTSSWKGEQGIRSFLYLTKSNILERFKFLVVFFLLLEIFVWNFNYRIRMLRD